MNDQGEPQNLSNEREGEQRRSSSAAILQLFKYTHLPAHLQNVSKPFCNLAEWVAAGPQNAETILALRKLLEAKDAAVRTLRCGLCSFDPLSESP